MTSKENQPTVYRSAVTWWPGIFAAALIIGSCIWILTIDTAFIWYVAGIILFSALLFYLAYTGTYYVIDGELVRIHNGFRGSCVVDIQQIRSVTVADLPFVRNSLSLHSIMLNIPGSGGIQLSPDDRAGFINQLKEINPRIIIGPGVIN